MWNIVVCDDEKTIRDDLSKKIVKLYKNEVSIYQYSNGLSLAGDIEEGTIKPDIIFMDIKLISSNGIVISKKILDVLPICQIIFVSGYDDYYLDVYEVEHVYFIKKPIRERTIQKALERAMDKIIEEKNDYFYFNQYKKTMVIPMNKILYFEKDKRKILIHLSDGSCHGYYGKMDELKDKLNGDFIRCHNSYVVNLCKVTAMEKDKFFFGESREVPISRFYQKEAKKAFMDKIEIIAS